MRSQEAPSDSAVVGASLPEDGDVGWGDEVGYDEGAEVGDDGAAEEEGDEYSAR